MSRRFTNEFRALLICVAVLPLGCSKLLSSPRGTFARGLPAADAAAGGLAEGGPPTARTARFSAYLKAPIPHAQAQFGSALAADAKNLFVAAAFEDVPIPSGVARGGGAVYAYDLQNIGAAPDRFTTPNVDALDGQLPTDISPSSFPRNSEPWAGLRLALSDHSIAIGVPGEDSASVAAPSDNSALESGAVYVYERGALEGAPQYIKAPTPQPRAIFGQSVSLSGSRLAVGAGMEDGIATDSGAVYVYEEINGRFDTAPAHIARIAPETGHDGDLFGMSVAIDGDLLVVGAPGESRRAIDAGTDPSDAASPLVGDGAVYVYRFSGGKWTQDAFLKPTVSAAYSLFGFSLSLSGGRFVVGAPNAQACPGEGVGAAQRGAAYIVDQAAGAWSVGQCLSPDSGPRTAFFGWNVALLGDRLAVGAPWEGSGNANDPTDTSAPFAGAASLYELPSAGSWRDAQYLKAPSIKQNNTFGFSAALVPGRVIIGAQLESGGQSGPTADPSDESLYRSGAVYLFFRSVGLHLASDAGSRRRARARDAT